MLAGYSKRGLGVVSLVPEARRNNYEIARVLNYCFECVFAERGGRGEKNVIVVVTLSRVSCTVDNLSYWGDM